MQDRFSILGDDYYMTMGGRILQEEHLLATYRITDDTMIHMRLRAKGGMMPFPEAFQHCQQVDSFTDGQPSLPP